MGCAELHCSLCLYRRVTAVLDFVVSAVMNNVRAFGSVNMHRRFVLAGVPAATVIFRVYGSIVWSFVLKGLCFIVLPPLKVFRLTGKKRRFKIEILTLYSLVLLLLLLVVVAVVIVVVVCYTMLLLFCIHAVCRLAVLLAIEMDSLLGTFPPPSCLALRLTHPILTPTNPIPTHTVTPCPILTLITSPTHTPPS